MDIKHLVNNYLAFVRKLIPENKKGTSVGIDIGTHSAAMIELVEENGGFRIVQCVVEPVTSNNTKEVVKKLLDKATIENISPNTSVSGKGTLIRCIESPRMNLEELRNSFMYEADKYFPFPKDQIYTDCYILDPEGKDKRMSVLVSAAKMDIVDKRVQLLEDLGLSADFISLNPIALANVFQYNHRTIVQKDEVDNQEQPTVAILNIEYDLSSLLIMKDNLPQFTRDIFIGANDFNERISNVLTLTPEKADQMRKDPGDRAEEIKEACSSILANLLAEIRLSFDYFITEQNSPINKVLLIGSGAQLTDVESVMSQHLELPVERWNPLLNFEFEEGLNTEEINKVKGQLGIALGLALSEYD